MQKLREAVGRLSSWLRTQNLHADIQAKDDSAEASLTVIQHSLDNIVSKKLQENYFSIKTL